MKHPRTTISGLMTVAGSLLTFAAICISTGHVPPVEQWAVLGWALTVGGGLIGAADGNKAE